MAAELNALRQENASLKNQIGQIVGAFEEAVGMPMPSFADDVPGAI
jgi:hypothetical protein